jgi:tetratricopeptide (TPR) repeat protein
MIERWTALRNRGVEFPAALVGFARLVFVGLLLALGVSILRHSLGDYLSGEADPALAIVVDPTQASARVAVSERLMADSKNADAVAGAREALRDNPLLPEALTLLARASEQEGDVARATQLMNLATRVNRRDLRSQLWLLAQDLRGGGVNSALNRVDVLLRGQFPQAIGPIVPALAPILTREPYRLGYVNLLRKNPRWREVWFVDLLRRSDDLSALTYLFAELQADGPGPTEEELQVLLTRLIDAGMFDEAHDVWLRSLPPDRREEADLLYNQEFRYPLTNLPFDWIIQPVSNAMVRVGTQNGGHPINVDFFGGRVKFEHVSHLLNLAPGAYRFQGREHSQDLQNERGLRWRIACVGDTAETLAATDLVSGDTDWRPFAVDFMVPTGKCSYQKLVLELPARATLETEVVGRVSYADLDLRPK